jgi:hypothetical protein
MSDKFDKSFMLTSNEVEAMFEHAGLPRTQRSIERYCKFDKLECQFDTDEMRWYITQKSAERLIGQIKEIQARHEKNEPVGLGPTVSDTPRQEATAEKREEKSEQKSSVGSNEEEFRKLRARVRRLQIDAEVNKRYIERLELEREKDRDRMLSQSHQIGALETQLNQIEAPKPEPKFKEREPNDFKYRDADIDRQASQSRSAYDFQEPEEPEAPHTNYQPWVEEPLDNQNNLNENHERVSLHPTSSGEQNHFSPQDEYPRQ